MVYNEEDHSSSIIHDVAYTDIKRLKMTFSIEGNIITIRNSSNKKALAEDLKFLKSKKDIIPGYFRTFKNILSILRLRKSNIDFIKQAVNLYQKEKHFNLKLRHLSTYCGLSVNSLKNYIGYYGTKRFIVNHNAIKLWIKEVIVNKEEENNTLTNQGVNK